MSRILVYGMVYLGSALMVYNIYGFISFAGLIKNQKKWVKAARTLQLPVVLLVLFLLGYLAVGIFGNPDLIVSGILFGGSIFVFVIYRVLNDLFQQMIEAEQTQTRLLAAEESNQIKNSFLSRISHEMRTPMNVILGLGNIALRNPDLQPETKELLEKIRLNSRHLLGLINNMLDINRIDTGEMTLKNEKFLLSETIAEMNALTANLCYEKGLIFSSAVWKGLETYYLGDDLLIRRALFTILDNAVKYTEPDGKVFFSVAAIHAEDDVDEIRFTVQDTGVGISSEFMPKIFEIFSQEDDTSTSRYGGSGVGLSMASRIVRLMDGRIEVESEKGVGSTFTMIIHLKALPDEVADAPKNNALSLSGLRVLIADDVEENAEIVADLLGLEKAESEHAENGQVAVEMVKNSPLYYYSAVLMDLRMPVMDGLTAAREIRQLDRIDVKGMPIIALTANTFDSDIQQTMDAGMNAHLAKPVDADLLYATLKNWVQDHQAAMNL